MKIKTAEEIHQENGCNTKKDIIEAMREYAAQFIDLAAEEMDTKEEVLYGKVTHTVLDIESILNIKQLIK